MKNFARKFLSVTLAAMMLLSMLPTVAFAADSSDNFYRIVHLDNGRKYFSKEWIIALINEMSEAGFNQLQLAFGNDGMRFLLDDMEITVDGATYSSDAVTEGIQEGNAAYYDEDVNELTEDEMDEILAHADSMGIDIVPHMNMPGHMDAILDAIEYVGISNAHFTGYTTSVRSLNLNNSSAVNFTLALLSKYVDYFAGKGCKFFHIGADEFGNDAYGKSMGFPSMGSTLYAEFADFVNDAAAIVKKAGMTPRAWNDGISYTEYSAQFDTDIQITYWSSGWWGYNVASASTLDTNGHDMINTHGSYYYILGADDAYTSGDSTSHVGYDYTAAEGFENTTFMGTSGLEGVGSMFCIWGDVPGAETETEVAKYVRPILRVMGARMNDSNSYEVESIVSGGFKEDGTINKDSEVVEPEAPETNSITDEETDVTITAPGLESVHVNFRGAEADDKEAWIKYDIRVAGSADAKYYVDMPFMVPYNKIFDQCDLGTLTANVDGEPVTGLAVAEVDGKTYITGVAPHFSTLTITGTIEETTEPNVKNVTLYVGEGAEATIEGGDYRDTIENSASDIVEVEASYESVQGSSGVEAVTSVSNGDQVYLRDADGNYLTQNGETTADIDSAALWSAEYDSYYQDYRFKNIDNAYLQYNDGAGWTTSIYGTYFWLENGVLVDPYGEFADTLTPVIKTGTEAINATVVTFKGLEEGTATVTVGSVTYNVTVKYHEESLTITRNTNKTVTQNAEIPAGNYTDPKNLVTVSVDGTDVTFTAGNELGTTELQIGNTKYTITIVAFDPSTVTPLTIEYWMTNSLVVSNDGEFAAGNTSYEISAADAYKEEGVLVASFAPKVGTTKASQTYDALYWKSVVLTYTGENTGHNESGKGYCNGWQKEINGCDHTAAASVMYVRYWGSEWQYSANGTTWSTFDNVADSDTRNQLVAYYLLKSDLAEEAIVAAKDWGFHSGESWGWGPDTPAFLTVEVVFPNGDTAPADLAKSTWIFGYSNGRKIGYYLISPALNVNGVEYEIYRVTDTPGTGDYNTDTLYTVTVEDLNFNGTETTLMEAPIGKNLGDSIILDSNDTTFPVTLEWNSTYNARRIRLYIREVTTAESLIIRYVDETTGVTIYETSVTAAHDEDFEDITYSEGAIAPNTVKKLDGDDYTIQTDLKGLPEIAYQYESAKYDFVGIDKENENKTLILKYHLNAELRNAVFVYDFGLPMTITPAMLDMDGNNPDSVTVYGADVTTNGANFTFQPDSASTNGYMFTVIYSRNGQEAAPNYVTMLPASNVLYEEGFFKGSGGSTTGHVDIQSEDQEVRYGYDAGYAEADNDTTSGETFNGDVESVGAMTGQLTTSFYGHTFDLIGTCAQDSGIVYLIIKGNGLTKLTIIDTSHSQNTYYQAPLAHVEMRNANNELVEGEYSVTVFGAYRAGVVGGASKTPAVSEANSTFVEIDGFRVYRSSANTAYMASEQNVEYQRALDLVQSGALQGVYVDDTTGNYSVDDYESEGGPQNEIYMPIGTTVTFKITGDAPNQISLRSVTGADITAKVSGEEIKIGHVTELYYPVTTANGVVTIENVSGGMLAVCNVKVAAGATFEAVSEADMASLFALLDVFVPERIDFQVRTLDLYRRQSTTLIVTTSTDVAYLRINGRKIKPSNARLVKYGLADEYTFVLSKTTKVGEVASFEIVAYNAEGDESQSYYIED